MSHEWGGGGCVKREDVELSDCVSRVGGGGCVKREDVELSDCVSRVGGLCEERGC